jgi:hypothetical protein
MIAAFGGNNSPSVIGSGVPDAVLAAYVAYLQNEGTAAKTNAEFQNLRATNFRGPNVSQDTAESLEAFQPDSAFRAGQRDRGLPQTGLLGDVLRRQFSPTSASFNFNRLLNPGTANRSIQGFTAETPNPYGKASELFKSVTGGTPFGRSEEFKNDPSDLENFLFRAGGEDPEDMERARAFRGEFQDLARGAATAKYGPYASQFLPGQSSINRRLDDDFFGAATAGGTKKFDLGDIFRQAFGI